ncbi:GHR protein, partial [Polypterus senegalus]
MLAGGQDVLAVLGKELLECLYWRRGALLYMYCYTLQQRKQWIKSNIPSFLKWLHEGVHFLMRMLQVKNSIQLSDGVVFHDSSTAKLLTEGVFSDTHLLTMMYIGEMCFWAVKYDDCDTSTPDRIKENLNFRDIGKQILSKYVTVCEGIGSGISFMFKNQQKLNIITLYSAVRKERERARTEQSNIQNPAFLQGDERATENCTRRCSGYLVEYLVISEPDIELVAVFVIPSVCYTGFIPDPPVNLNWTLLNTSQTGLHYDILLRWEAPPTADVAKGWITLIYEVQYRAVNDTEWKVMEHEKETYLSIYGLKTNTIYEIRIRCLQLNFDKFSRFSDIVYVYNFVPVTKESTFPVAFVLIFIVVGVAIVLMLIIFTRQHRLMMLLLPPVPIPKIKGIDPELLKKGKLDELNSILSNQQTYKTEFTNDDLWVEFIELDIDDPDEKLGHSDTHRLLSLEHLKSGKSLSMKDDDSGRASCYEPEIPEMDSLAFNVNLMEGNPEKACVLNSEGTVPNPDLSSPNATQPKAEPEKAKIESSGSEENMPVRPYPLIQTQMSNQSWANMDFYAQVSDITPAGGVLLSPGQQCKSEKTPEKEKPDEAKKYQFAMTSDSAYTSEIDAKKLSAIPTTNENDQNPEKDLSSANCISTENQSEESPYTTNETTVITMPPVSDYTSVHMVDSQHSLLLNPTAVQTKDMSMQVGYLTPDQMSSIMP